MSRYIDEHRGRLGVEPICRTLGVSASAYYQPASGKRSARAIEDERLLQLIRETHKRNYEAYGYRRTWKALLRKGERMPRCGAALFHVRDGKVTRIINCFGRDHAFADLGLAPEADAP